MTKERCIILIDGSNFYFKLKDLNLTEANFNFSAFAKTLSIGDAIVKAIYYVGAVRTDGTKHTQKLFNNQQKLFGNLKKHRFDNLFAVSGHKFETLIFLLDLR